MTATIANRSLTKKHKWSLDLSRSRVERTSDLTSPPGYNLTVGVTHSEGHKEADTNLIVKKSWDIALSPLKQVPMNLFIMYMAGNSISIVPIMMIGMLFLRPVKALIAIQSTFKVIEGRHSIGQKLVYMLGNVVSLALALYKCQSMGLLPTHASDWLAFVEPPTRVEFSGGGLVFQ